MPIPDRLSRRCLAVRDRHPGAVFLAGLALFGVSPNWDTHISFGHLAPGLLALAMLVFAWGGRLPRQTFRLTGLLFLLVILQTEVFAAVRSSAPLLAALHPVNAMLIFALGLTLATRARGLAEAQPTSNAPPRCC